jgi:hypothetical protein
MRILIPQFKKLYFRATNEFQSGNLELSVKFCRDALAVPEIDAKDNWKDKAAVQLNLSHILKLQCNFS